MPLPLIPLAIAGAAAGLAFLSGCGDGEDPRPNPTDPVEPPVEPDPKRCVDGIGEGCIPVVVTPTTTNPLPVDVDTDGDGVLDKDDCNPRDKYVYPGAPELVDGVRNDCNNTNPSNVIRASSMGMVFTVPDEIRNNTGPLAANRPYIQTRFADLNQDGKLEGVFGIQYRTDHLQDAIAVCPLDPFVPGAKVLINPETIEPNSICTLVRPDGSTQMLGGLLIKPERYDQSVGSSYFVANNTNGLSFFTGYVSDDNVHSALVNLPIGNDIFRTPQVITVPGDLSTPQGNQWLESTNAYAIGGNPNNRYFGYDLQIQGGYAVFAEWQATLPEGFKYHFVPLLQNPPRYKNYTEVEGRKEFLANTNNPDIQLKYSLRVGDANNDGQLDAIASHEGWPVATVINNITSLPNNVNLLDPSSLSPACNLQNASASFYALRQSSGNGFASTLGFANFSNSPRTDGTEIVTTQYSGFGVLQSIPAHVLESVAKNNSVDLSDIDSTTTIEGDPVPGNGYFGYLGFTSIDQNRMSNLAGNTSRQPVLLVNGRYDFPNEPDTVHVFTASDMPLTGSALEASSERIISDGPGTSFGWMDTDNSACDTQGCKVAIHNKNLEAYVLPAR